jgi:phage gpG-like protein
MALRVTKTIMQLDKPRLQQLLGEAANHGVDRAATQCVRFIKQSFTKTSWFQPSPVGGPPGTVTGNLRRSITATPAKNGRAIVGTNARYARSHEHEHAQGVVLKPTTKKYLTIPVSVAAAKMRANTKDLRTQNLTFRKGPNRGVAFLFRTTKGKNARSELMFVLKRSVRMPPRPFLRPAARNRDNQMAMVKAFGAGFRSIIRKAFKPAPGSPA